MLRSPLNTYNLSLAGSGPPGALQFHMDMLWFS